MFPSEKSDPTTGYPPGVLGGQPPCGPLYSGGAFTGPYVAQQVDGECHCGTYKGWLLGLVSLQLAGALANLALVIYALTIIESFVPEGTSDSNIAMARGIMVAALVLRVVNVAFAVLPFLAEYKQNPNLFRPWSHYLKLVLVFAILRAVMQIFAVNARDAVNGALAVLDVGLLIGLIYVTRGRERQMFDKLRVSPVGVQNT